MCGPRWSPVLPLLPVKLGTQLTVATLRLAVNCHISPIWLPSRPQKQNRHNVKLPLCFLLSPLSSLLCTMSPLSGIQSNPTKLGHSATQEEKKEKEEGWGVVVFQTLKLRINILERLVCQCRCNTVVMRGNRMLDCLVPAPCTLHCTDYFK